MQPASYFKLPDLGEGVVEAEIVAWHVQAGRGSSRRSAARRRDDRQGDGDDPQRHRRPRRVERTATSARRSPSARSW